MISQRSYMPTFMRVFVNGTLEQSVSDWMVFIDDILRVRN